MTQNIWVCHVDDDITDAALVMEQKKVRRLSVVNRDGHTVGVLSLDDISAADASLSGEALRIITEHPQLGENT